MTDNAMLAVLQSIDASLKTLVVLSRQRAERAATATPSGRPAQAVATDADLDSQYGDPEVRFDPRDWTGQPYKGAHFSATEPEFLEMLAEILDEFAAKEDDPKKAGYKRKDAARARGWALRMRAGKGLPVQARPSFAAGY